ncbi:MAG: HAMP domain-containing sensor histidine kinase [bacterium]
MKDIYKKTILMDTETTRNLIKQAAVGRIMHGVGHELNNQIAAILGYTELLLLSKGSGRQETMDMLSIRDAAQRCGDMINAMMNLTLKKNGRGPAPFEVESAVRDVVVLLEKPFRSKNVRINCEFPPDPTLLEGSKNDFMVVLLLLFLKLTDGMPRGTRVCVRVGRPASETVEIDLAVSSEGYPELQPPKSLEPFPRSLSGEDLTESICETALENMGGILYEESGPSGNRRFVVELPVAKSRGRESLMAV